MAERTSREVLLPGWQFDDYNTLLAKEDQTLPPYCSWEDFEKFNARYCCIKSLLKKISAESGNTVLSLDTSPPANEIQQYKLFTNSTEKECKIKLSNNSGIVDRSNWRKYFGPFFGRAFAYGVEDTLNINKSSFTTLQLVNGVGPRPYLNVEDAITKTGLPRFSLEQYKY
ncbi:hypothetical protein BC937DRAFT_91470 [Endogone sp. FLAS-F59071]|nr:hypothetical protein BC937DRAFT_91470 [Endogone sp. FLAS-F59071]|eukprot:RUS16230.1 hypothetical protein BC937DRAFT_91470 [Endogone sp. FLAS-F59071]